MLILLLLPTIISVIILGVVLSNGGASATVTKSLDSLTTPVSKIGNTTNDISIIQNTILSQGTQTLNTSKGTNDNVIMLNSTVAGIPGAIGNDLATTGNQITNEITNTINAQGNVINGINSNVIGLPALISNAVNQSLNSYFGNIVIGNELPINTIRPWTITQNITPGNYLVYGLPDTFSNHLRINASNQIVVAVMTIWQFVNFSKGTSGNSISSYNSSGAFNSVNFFVNQTEGCSLYEVVVAHQADDINSIITFKPNLTSTLMPAAALQGICKP